MNALIEVDELAAALADPECVAIDCRFDLFDPEAGARQYAEAHIRGARYANLDRDLARKPGPEDGRHPLPNPETFAAWKLAVGIGACPVRAARGRIRAFDGAWRCPQQRMNLNRASA